MACGEINDILDNIEEKQNEYEFFSIWCNIELVEKHFFIFFNKIAFDMWCESYNDKYRHNIFYNFDDQILLFFKPMYYFETISDVNGFDYDSFIKIINTHPSEPEHQEPPKNVSFKDDIKKINDFFSIKSDVDEWSVTGRHVDNLDVFFRGNEVKDFFFAIPKILENTPKYEFYFHYDCIVFDFKKNIHLTGNRLATAYVNNIYLIVHDKSENTINFYLPSVFFNIDKNHRFYKYCEEMKEYLTVKENDPDFRSFLNLEKLNVIDIENNNTIPINNEGVFFWKKIFKIKIERIYNYSLSETIDYKNRNNIYSMARNEIKNGNIFNSINHNSNFLKIKKHEKLINLTSSFYISGKYREYKKDEYGDSFFTFDYSFFDFDRNSLIGDPNMIYPFFLNRNEHLPVQTSKKAIFFYLLIENVFYVIYKKNDINLDCEFYIDVNLRNNLSDNNSQKSNVVFYDYNYSVIPLSQKYFMSKSIERNYNALKRELLRRTSNITENINKILNINDDKIKNFFKTEYKNFINNDDVSNFIKRYNGKNVKIVDAYDTLFLNAYTISDVDGRSILLKLEPSFIFRRSFIMCVLSNNGKTDREIYIGLNDFIPNITEKEFLKKFFTEEEYSNIMNITEIDTKSIKISLNRKSLEFFQNIKAKIHLYINSHVKGDIFFNRINEDSKFLNFINDISTNFNSKNPLNYTANSLNLEETFRNTIVLEPFNLNIFLKKKIYLLTF